MWIKLFFKQIKLSKCARYLCSLTFPPKRWNNDTLHNYVPVGLIKKQTYGVYILSETKTSKNSQYKTNMGSDCAHTYNSKTWRSKTHRQEYISASVYRLGAEQQERWWWSWSLNLNWIVKNLPLNLSKNILLYFEVRTKVVSLATPVKEEKQTRLSIFFYRNTVNFRFHPLRILDSFDWRTSWSVSLPFAFWTTRFGWTTVWDVWIQMSIFFYFINFRFFWRNRIIILYAKERYSRTMFIMSLGLRMDCALYKVFKALRAYLL